MFKFRYLFLFMSSLFADFAFADYYEWVVQGTIAVYSSPSAACASKGTIINQRMSSTYTGGVRRETDTTFLCHELISPVAPYDFASYSSYSVPVYRYGSRCMPNTEYNPETGECKAPVSPPQSFEFLYCYNYDGGDGCAPGTQKGRPDSFCKDGELFEADYSPGTTDAECFSNIHPDGTSGTAVMCRVTATSSGQSCGADYSPEKPNNACPAGTKGGVFNGKHMCVPSGDGGETGGGETGGNGDGNEGGDTGGGESGGGNSGGNGNGTGGSGSGGNSGGGNTGGNGTGDSGSGGNSGGGNTGGNGNGTGDGDGSGGTGGNGNGSGTGGTGDGDGEGQQGSPSGEGVENCTDGGCGFGDLRKDPFDGEVRTFSASMEAFYDGISSSPISSSIKNIRFPTGGTCPVGSTNIDFGFGSFNIEFSEHCNFWQQISPIISAAFLALWAVVAVRVFLSA